MDQYEKDELTINALVLRMDEYGIPRARHLLDKVNAGEVLSERDINFLKRVYRDCRLNQSLIRRDHEFQDIMSKFIDLYTEICEKALENEKARSTPVSDTRAGED